MIDNTTIFILAEHSSRQCVCVHVCSLGRRMRMRRILFAVYTSFWALHKSILAAQSLKLLLRMSFVVVVSCVGLDADDDNGFRKKSHRMRAKGRRKEEKTFLYSEIKRFTIYNFLWKSERTKGINCRARTRRRLQHAHT